MVDVIERDAAFEAAAEEFAIAHDNVVHWQDQLDHAVAYLAKANAFSLGRPPIEVELTQELRDAIVAALKAVVDDRVAARKAAANQLRALMAEETAVTK